MLLRTASPLLWVAAPALGIGSKFLMRIGGKHFFNPATFAIVTLLLLSPVGAVGAPQSLDCGIGAPAGFQQIMDALALVAAGAVGVIAAAGAAGIGEDKDALVV